MQANRRVYGLGAVGRLLLTDRSGPDARFIVVETPRKGDPGSQPPGIGGMSDEAVHCCELELPPLRNPMKRGVSLERPHIGRKQAEADSFAASICWQARN